MDLNYLKKVIKIFDESNLAEIRIEEESLKLKLSKFVEMDKTISVPTLQVNSSQSQIENNSESNVIAHEIHEKEILKEEEVTVGHVIKSPIVGTFYKSPSPDSEPFVEVGQHITKGSPLCIIEAMKLMNEIESDISGTVSKILLVNGQPVEYGQPMFVIKAD